MRSARLSGERAELLLSNDDHVALDFATLREGPDNALYCDAYPGQTARFDSHAAVQLGALLEEDDKGTYFRQGSTRVRPLRSTEPLTPLSAFSPPTEQPSAATAGKQTKS